MVNLPDVLVGALFVLSLLPSPFTLELMGPLLALAQTKPGKHAVLRRLVNLGLLNYNASLQQYSMHKVVREAARLLAHNLGKAQPKGVLCQYACQGLKALAQPLRPVTFWGRCR